MLEAGLREEGQEEGNWESRTPSRDARDALELFLAFSASDWDLQASPQIGLHCP